MIIGPRPRRGPPAAAHKQAHTTAPHCSCTLHTASPAPAAQGPAPATSQPPRAPAARRRMTRRGRRTPGCSSYCTGEERVLLYTPPAAAPPARTALASIQHLHAPWQQQCASYSTVARAARSQPAVRAASRDQEPPWWWCSWRPHQQEQARCKTHGRLLYRLHTNF